MKEFIPEIVFSICKTLTNKGFETVIVGGSIRDLIMGNDPHDWDLATAATPTEIIETFPNNHRVTTGIKHGTVVLVFNEIPYEITTFRTEKSYSDGRHPDEVIFTKSLKEDLSRRDFTMNAIAYRPITNVIIDHFEGCVDIDKGIIRTVGNPQKRFAEDGLRVLRAIRFMSQLDFSFEEHTWNALLPEYLKNLSIERIQVELVKILQGKNSSQALSEMYWMNLLDEILPEFVSMHGMLQNQYHNYDVWGHTLKVLKEAPIHLKIAAFFHDIGKTITRAPKKDCPGEFTFYRHDTEGAKLTKQIMERFKFSNEEIKHTVHLVKNHMLLHLGKNIKGPGIRRAIQRIGKENLQDIFDLSKADLLGMGKTNFDELWKEQLVLIEKFNEELSKPGFVNNKRDLAVNGEDLIEKFQRKSGPWVGNAISHLMEYVIEKPEKNNKEELLSWIEGWRFDNGNS